MSMKNEIYNIPKRKIIKMCINDIWDTLPNPIETNMMAIKFI